MQFYVSDALDQILDELRNRAEDAAHESDFGENIDNETELSLSNQKSYQNWIEFMKDVLESLTYRTVDSLFIEKTISIILSCMATMRNQNTPPSEAEFSFSQADKQLKQSVFKYNVSNQTKQNSKFLNAEFYSIVKQIVNFADVKSQIQLVQHAIKYGQPLPLASAAIVTVAFDKFLQSSSIYSSGLHVQVKDKVGTVLASYGNGKAKLGINEFNGYVYICQTDYRASIGMRDQMNEEVDSAFFYEAFVSFKKYLRCKFPKKAESLREGLLKELENLNRIK